MSQSSLWFPAALMALVVGAAACGGEDPIVQAMSDQMVTQDDGLSADPAEADCIAKTTYEALGSDRLDELGITVDNPDITTAGVTEEEANQLVDGLYGCIDVNKMIISQITATGLGPEVAQCMIDSLGSDAIRQLMIDQFAGREPQLGQASQAMLLECMAG